MWKGENSRPLELQYETIVNRLDMEQRNYVTVNVQSTTTSDEDGFKVTLSNKLWLIAPNISETVQNRNMFAIED